MKKFLGLLSLVLFGLFTLVPLTASADDYPTKPIRLIVPVAPGGATDIVARLYADELGKILRQPVVVENMAGAGSLIGANFVARAPADGYTLLLSSASNFGLAVDKVLYDPIKDFVPISQLAILPSVVVVPSSSEIKSIADLISFAKANPHTAFYGTGGIGTSVDVGALLFNKEVGVHIERVVYKGSGPALLDLMSNRVQVMFDNLPSSMPHIQSGQLRALAVTSESRQPTLPKIPTMAEAGLPNYKLVTWLGISAPKGLSADKITTLAAAIAKASTSHALQASLSSAGAQVAISSPNAFAQLIAENFQQSKGLYGKK